VTRAICATLLLAALTSTACTDGAQRTPVATAGDLSIYDAYAPASAAPDVASLYFTVVNGATADDTLLAIRIVDGKAELHDVVTEDGLTRMQHVPALPIPAGGTARLAPGGYHVMLTELSAPLEVGQTVPVALVFARGGTVRFAVPVLTYTDVVQRLEGGPER
jgi:copper(I)-binding protein